jgi:hypothetical protein
MAVTRTVRIGLDGFLYRNTGSYASPTWSEMKHVKDLSIAAEVNEVEASDRDSVFALIEKGLIQFTVEFGYRYADGDAEWEALITELLSRGVGAEFAIMDGDITDTGEKGWRMTAHVMAANQSQELESAYTMDITLKPCANSDGNPQRYTAP